MRFDTVPAGTLPPAALALRGSDHDLVMATNHVYQRILGNAHATQNGAAANTKVGKWSRVAGAVVGYMFTSDQAVLDSGAHLSVPHHAACGRRTKDGRRVPSRRRDPHRAIGPGQYAGAAHAHAGQADAH